MKILAIRELKECIDEILRLVEGGETKDNVSAVDAVRDVKREL